MELDEQMDERHAEAETLYDVATAFVALANRVNREHVHQPNPELVRRLAALYRVVVDAIEQGGFSDLLDEGGAAFDPKRKEGHAEWTALRRRVGTGRRTQLLPSPD